jgi:hypothetical protein
MVKIVSRDVKTTAWEQSLYDLPPTISCEDDLATAINEMKHCSIHDDFECAEESFEKVKEILSTPRPGISEPHDPCRDKCRTLLSVHDELRSNPIRLNHEKMDIAKYLRLLENVQTDVFIRGEKALRDITAHNMSELMLPPQPDRGRDAPNRAFMDVLFKHNPNLASKDLRRREETKMWYAIKYEDEESKKNIRKMFKEIKKAELEQ